MNFAGIANIKKDIPLDKMREDDRYWLKEAFNFDSKVRLIDFEDIIN